MKSGNKVLIIGGYQGIGNRLAKLYLYNGDQVFATYSRLKPKGYTSKNAFTVLGGKSLGRIDIKMDHRGIPHFIEANLMPGLRKGYFYRSCLLNLNMNYEQMILSVADNGLSSQRIHFSTNSIRGKS